MAAVKHSAEDEAAFLNVLLSGLDDSFCNATPSSPAPARPSPKKDSVSTRPMQSTPRKHANKAASPSKVFSAGDIDIDALLEGAEDWDMDIDSFELSPRKERLAPSSAFTPTLRDSYTRCTVESVVRSDGQLNLVVKVIPGYEHCAVTLTDDWVHLDVRVGDTVNVVGQFTTLSSSSSLITSSITVTAKANLLILHPDILLTATALSNAPQCLRKPLLSALVHSSSDATPALVWGNLLHTIVQSCLSEKRWDEAWIDDQIDAIIREAIGDLAKIGFDVEQGKREIKARAQGLKSFGGKYISTSPKPNAVLTNTRSTRDQAPSSLAITQLLDIEEDIWSPKYGLKGKLDATVQTVILESPTSRFAKPPALVSGPKPLEIKTGRVIAGAAIEHRAQTMLYTLMTEERYGAEVESGLLWYTQSEEVIRVPVVRNEIRGLIMARNQMAAWIVRRQDIGKGDADEPFLPPTIDDERVCKRCYALDTCMLYRKAIENVVDATSPIANIYDLKTSHLTSGHCEFFKSWERLLSLEEQDLTRFRRELWTMNAKEREAKGRCFAGMVFDERYQPKGVKKRQKIHRFEYRFTKNTLGSLTSSLLNGAMSVGDAITISVDPHLLALSRGFIIELSSTTVVVGVDHEVSLETIKSRLVTFCKPALPPAPIIFRIDRDELLGGMSRVRDNLAQLFYADGDTKRLRLVVDLESPKFQDTSLSLPSVTSHSAHLNADQQQAMEKVLAAEDYALVLGMPGTGKTTTIVAIIKTLVEMGQTILLTSYTHSAVDTILLKLQDHAGFTILRLGNADKIHPDVRKFTLAARKTPESVEQMEQQFMTPPVVATTCLSVDHVLFSRRKFDWCIVDEASQITLPTCLGPLRFADKFVLVGDHLQLPPLVRNAAARKGGLDVSLFRRLADAHPHAVVDLAHQYRMNADIMLLSNKLIYSDRLKCGSVEVAKRLLTLPDSTYLQSLHKTPCHRSGCWLERLMSPSCSVVFVDTDAIPARENRVGDLVQNEIEASLVQQTTETLIRSGISAEQIGVISMYRQQIKLLGQLLGDQPGLESVEILTADRSQGRDKDCIIISMVRSNESGQIGELVKDWRRMNVAFTRARSKLIIFGSRKTLQAEPLLKQFFELISSKGWILKVAMDAHYSHSFPSKKRVGGELKENMGKKPKLKDEPGLLRNRPILRDLVNGER